MRVPEWDLDRTLLDFGAGDQFTIRNAVEGVHALGQPGSGKSSGPLRHLGLAYLRAGFGALVLCAKPEEASDWIEVAEKAGRSRSVIRFALDQPWRFNPFEYEQKRRGGGETENLLQLLTTIASTGTRADKEKDTWQRALEATLRSSIDLLKFAEVPVSMQNIDLLINGAPTQESPDIDPNGLFARCMAATQSREAELPPLDYRTTLQYWERSWFDLAARTRSSVLLDEVSLASVLMRGTFGTLFSEGCNVVPEHIMEGAIVIVDLPINEYHDAGRYAAQAWKYSLQRALLARPSKASTVRPVAIIMDESQNFVTSYDPVFLSQSRSAKAASIYATQNNGNYRTILSTQDSIDAFMANITNHFMCRNADNRTNTYASKRVQQVMVERTRTSRSRSSGSSHQQLSLTGSTSSNRQESTSTSHQREYELSPREFLSLRTGAPPNNYKVDAILFAGGDLFAESGRPFRKVTFDQRTL